MRTGFSQATQHKMIQYTYVIVLCCLDTLRHLPLSPDVLQYLALELTIGWLAQLATVQAKLLAFERQPGDFQRIKENQRDEIV